VLFEMLQGVTALVPRGYPTAPPDGGDAVLHALLGEVPPPGANDGVVPLRSQLWGRPLWIGAADHLDVIGHFRGRGHTDWLTSGADFDEPRFGNVMDRIVAGMLEAEERPDTRAAGRSRGFGGAGPPA
jgi:triacylglycerol lipase